MIQAQGRFQMQKICNHRKRIKNHPASLASPKTNFQIPIESNSIKLVLSFGQQFKTDRWNPFNGGDLEESLWKTRPRHDKKIQMKNLKVYY